MATILITGAYGQLGHEFQALQLEFPELDFVFTDRDQLDIANADQVKSFFDRQPFDYCLNCAAYTAVDKAESEPALAYLINEKGPANLAAACQEHGATLIQFSSDYVYHNALNRPLLETDPVTPKGVYAASKLAGEQAAIAANPQTLVLRTSWIYSSFGHNFVKTMLRLSRERRQLKVVYDQIGAPTYARDLARNVLDIIQSEQAARHPGIYNFSNEGVTSWYDFALAIFELSGVHCQVTPIGSSAYPTAANRPHYSLLDKEKFKTTFGKTIPHWKASLAECLSILILEE